ncbi:SprT family zinc-dependent metalloprotease [Thaumasiovibrio sp. DFM-14]|uniref:SprT family zinc-dependent metalloprotease n=1 Tax=Thaumasiovibrio sp. DFM-14 TaxID=3384792 RepID=UPI0039A21EC4
MRLLEQQIVAQVGACLQQAQTALNQSFAMPTIRFNQRGKIAGSARLLQWELRFNPVLLKDNPEAFLQDVVPHEVAHLIVYQCFGRVRPHGKEWQAVMQQVFKRPAKTTHQFDVSQVQGQLYAYRCSCQTHQLTVRRHNKMSRQQVSYRCRTCGQALVPNH